jgi:hypothetical protein
MRDVQQAQQGPPPYEKGPVVPVGPQLCVEKPALAMRTSLPDNREANEAPQENMGRGSK